MMGGQRRSQDSHGAVFSIPETEGLTRWPIRFERRVSTTIPIETHSPCNNSYSSKANHSKSETSKKQKGLSNCLFLERKGEKNNVNGAKQVGNGPVPSMAWPTVWPQFKIALIPPYNQQLEKKLKNQHSRWRYFLKIKNWLTFNNQSHQKWTRTKSKGDQEWGRLSTSFSSWSTISALIEAHLKMICPNNSGSKANISSTFDSNNSHKATSRIAAVLITWKKNIVLSHVLYSHDKERVTYLRHSICKFTFWKSF